MRDVLRVIPVEAGIQGGPRLQVLEPRIAAFAGMTNGALEIGRAHR